jgi:phosphoglycolate phosphatase-like HAD superfamily hydrolase
MTEELLPSWRAGVARQTIFDFVERTCGANGVPVEERVAVFDNDGTLWCEKPMPIQLDFILRRFAEMAASQPELRERQPWKAVSEHDLGWFSALMTEHYAGDDTNVRTLAAGILAAYAGISVEDFEAESDAFLRSAQHPTLGRGYLQCGYAPMVELLGYLQVNGFSNYIVSGGGRDFMRPISQDMYGIPRERVIGSSSTFAYTSDEHGGTITHKPEADYLDDGPEKPVRIWSRTGRRPLGHGSSPLNGSAGDNPRRPRRTMSRRASAGAVPTSRGTRSVQVHREARSPPRPDRSRRHAT